MCFSEFSTNSHSDRRYFCVQWLTIKRIDAEIVSFESVWAKLWIKFIRLDQNDEYQDREDDEISIKDSQDTVKVEANYENELDISDDSDW